MTDRKRVTNYQLLELFDQKFTSLANEFKEFKQQYNVDMRGEKEFKDQYETDMRGDKKIDGNIGIINELRDIRRIIREYPSMLWLLKNEPKKTITTIVIIFVILSSLYVDDWRIALLGWLGVGH